MGAEATLEARGITLPTPATPLGHSAGADRTGHLLSRSGYGPLRRNAIGFSDLMVEITGEAAGTHARSAAGTAGLSLGIPVEIEMILEVE